jgi:hypothetical protein
MVSEPSPTRKTAAVDILWVDLVLGLNGRYSCAASASRLHSPGGLRLVGRQADTGRQGILLKALE